MPSKLKKKANRAKVQRRNAGKISKNPRGKNSSTVLHPTGGPNAPLSAKKLRKLEKAQNHARQRAIEKAMAEEGEIAMTGMFRISRGWIVELLQFEPRVADQIFADAPTTTKSKTVESEATAEKMEVDEMAA